MRNVFLLLIATIITATPVMAMSSHVSPSQAINSAIIRYGLRKEPNLIQYFLKAGVAYPPKDIALLAFKKEQIIQLWAKNNQDNWHFIHTYPLTAYSGTLGPKLKEYDRQIPEGIYRLTNFNPYSSMHLSLMINYPNEFDQEQAYKDGRRKLGGNIFLHGKASSVGCLAVGDNAIDELFLLTHRVGLGHVQLIIAPNDLRKSKAATNWLVQPKWLPVLYHRIGKALNRFPLQQSKSTA